MLMLQRKDFDYQSKRVNGLRSSCGRNDTKDINSSTSPIIFNINGLQPNTEYDIEVHAINTQQPSTNTIRYRTDETGNICQLYYMSVIAMTSMGLSLLQQSLCTLDWF